MPEKETESLAGLTIRALFDEAAGRLGREGIEDAVREAELLLCHVLEKDRIYLYSHGRDAAPEESSRLFLSLLSERIAGKPLQYIMGTAEFMGLELEVNPSVLIPRQDTELLAEAALGELSSRRENDDAKGDSSPTEKSKAEVLDLCTGSGALAIAIAKLCEDSFVTASDISHEALDTARKNALATGVADRIRFYEGDLFDALPSESSFDLIVSNPPYINSAVVDTLDVQVRGHEPRGALDGGEDGMDFIRRILEKAPFHLRAGGALLMEIGYDQGPRALALATAEKSPFAKARVLKDLGGNDRVLSVRLK